MSQRRANGPEEGKWARGGQMGQRRVNGPKRRANGPKRRANGPGGGNKPKMDTNGPNIGQKDQKEGKST
jgi:hypothetical protein